MKSKKILSLLIILCFMFLGISFVDAKTYTSYNRGDKITVNVNDTTKVSFYVVEDSDNTSTVVKAVTENFVNENTYTYAEASSLIVSFRSSPSFSCKVNNNS